MRVHVHRGAWAGWRETPAAERFILPVWKKFVSLHRRFPYRRSPTRERRASGRAIPAGHDRTYRKDVVTAFYLRLMNLANSIWYRNNAMFLRPLVWHITVIVISIRVGFGIAYSVPRAMREPHERDKQESCSRAFLCVVWQERKYKPIKTNNMKYKLSILAILLMAMALPQSVRAYDFSAVAPSGQTLFYNIIDGGVKVVYPGSSIWSAWSGHNLTGDLIIPATVTNEGVNYNVTSIDVNAFRNCTGLHSVSISNGITTIEGAAFYHCTGLTSVTISDGVTSIGSRAFSECTALTSISIPSSVISIVGNPFESCTSLATINVNNGNMNFDSRNNCNAIIKTATNTLIAGCKNTVIPDNVSSIGYGAFSGCAGLTSVNIPSGVTSIGGCAFRSCTGLTSVNIPNTVTEIYQEAFEGCTSLASITIPNSVIMISGGAFSSCPELASISVQLGNAVYDSRDNCNAIVESSSNILLHGCKNTIIPNSIIAIGDWAFCGHTGLTSINIPNSVTTLYSSAFRYCTGLTTITLPSSLTSIQSCAFGGCSSLTAVTSLAIVPPILGTEAFSGVSHDIPLYVPCDVVETYEASSWHEYFNNITCHTASVDDVDVINAKVYSRSGRLVVEGADGLTATLYDTAGRILAIKQSSNQTITFEVPTAGTYLVKVGDAPARRIVVVK